jgi:small conductance mechanosensitive channel
VPVPVLPAAAFGLPDWAGRLVLVGVILVAAALILAGVGWLMPRLSARSHRAGGARVRQRQTAITALATGIRYAILIAALLAIVFVLAGGGGIGAIGGASLVVIIIGFASQRLLVDVIAGFFILFEDQYGVGDVIRVEPFGYAGRVQSLGLRTTVLHGPAGERLIVPNGNITAVRVIPSGRRAHRIEFLTRDPERLEAIVRELAGAVTGGGGPWRAVPRMTRRPADDGLTRVVAVVDVDAAREDATKWLTDAIAERAADVLVVPPLRSVDPAASSD